MDHGDIGISAIVPHDDPRHPWMITVRGWVPARAGWRWLVDTVPHDRWRYVAGRNQFFFGSKEDAVMFYFMCLGGQG